MSVLAITARFFGPVLSPFSGFADSLLRAAEALLVGVVDQLLDFLLAHRPCATARLITIVRSAITSAIRVSRLTASVFFFDFSRLQLLNASHGDASRTPNLCLPVVTPDYAVH